MAAEHTGKSEKWQASKASPERDGKAAHEHDGQAAPWNASPSQQGSAANAGQNANPAQPAQPQPAKGEWKHPWAAQAGKQWSFWFLPLGLLGPLIGSTVWIIFIVIGMWLLKFANVVLQSAFLTLLINSVIANLQWFFIASLAIGYLDFFAKKFQPAGIYLFPFMNATGATFSSWIVAWIFRTVGAMAGIAFLTDIGVALRANLAIVFAIFLVLGALAIESRWVRYSP